MEEEHPFLLPSKGVRRSSRGFWPRVSVRLARIFKALGRSASYLRRRKPSCRLALCLQKASKSLTFKSKGKPSSNSPTSRHLKRLRRLFSSSLRVNNTLQPPRSRDGGDACDDGEHALESLALLHLQSSYKDDNASPTPYANPRLHKKDPFTHDHMMALSNNAKQHAHLAFGDYDDHRLKLRIRRWQRRMNGTLTRIGPHKTCVPPDVPKGCVGVYVGTEHTRFIVPILHLNHPLFASLFECMHEDDGFSQSGPLWIPCEVAEFVTLQSQVKQLRKQHRHGH
ncbi:hypothetical protein L7F22_058374 [Adiantum nelumboides]|nr:hypothetical protein [Adiantum nelumboides]